MTFFEQSVFFGVSVSLAAYGIGVLLQKKFKFALFNPLLISVVLTIAVLLTAHISYDTFYEGAKYLSYLLTPATVCLAVPLYEKLSLLKSNWKAIFAGILSGVITTLCSVFVMSKLFHLTHEEYVTLLPKSITTAIGMGVSEELGGYVTLTVAMIIITGIFGNVIAVSVCRLFRITDPIAKGVVIGTAAHAVGTAAASASPGSASAGHVWNALPGGRAATAHKACAAQSSHKRVVQRCFIRITSCFAQFTEVRWKNRAKGGGQSDNVLVYFFFSSGRDFCPPSCTPRRTQGWW